MFLPTRPFPPCPPPPGASEEELNRYAYERYKQEMEYMGRQPRLSRKDAKARFPSITDRSFPLRCRLFGHKERRASDMFAVTISDFPTLWFQEYYCDRCDTSYAVELPAPPSRAQIFMKGIKRLHQGDNPEPPNLEQLKRPDTPALPPPPPLDHNQERHEADTPTADNPPTPTEEANDVE